MKGLFQSSGRWRTVFIPAAALQPNVQLMQLAEKNQTGRGPADKVHKTLFEGLQLTVFKSLEPTSAEALW